MWNLLLIFIGGGAGSLCRYALSVLLPKSDAATHIPWATLSANVLGCLFIGLLSGYLGHRRAEWPYLLLVTGFCGGFTTFSTFSAEFFQLLRQGLFLPALAYAGLSFLCGIGMTALGFALTRP